MNKKKSQRMKPIKNLAEDQEKQAAHALGQSRQLLVNCQLRLQELNDYRNDYVQRFNTQGSLGMSGSRIQSFQTFISQLDSAIDRQKQLVSDAEDQCRVMQQDWNRRHMRTKALGKTVQRYETQERKQQEKHAQREADDRVHKRQTLDD